MIKPPSPRFIWAPSFLPCVDIARRCHLQARRVHLPLTIVAPDLRPPAPRPGGINICCLKHPVHSIFVKAAWADMQYIHRHVMSSHPQSWGLGYRIFPGPIFCSSPAAPLNLPFKPHPSSRKLPQLHYQLPVPQPAHIVSSPCTDCGWLTSWVGQHSLILYCWIDV